MLDTPIWELSIGHKKSILQEGHLHLLRYLSTQNCDLNQPIREFLRTPLHLAVENRRTSCIQFLLQECSVKDTADRDGVYAKDKLKRLNICIPNSS